MCGANFAFFALCLLLFLHYWRVVILTTLQATTVGYFCCVCSSECTNWCQWLFYFSWTGSGQEWTWCCSRVDIRVCVVFSFSVFFVVVCTIFICAVFLWAPEHLCDHGLDLWDQLICEFNKSINQSIFHVTWNLVAVVAGWHCRWMLRFGEIPTMEVLVPALNEPKFCFLGYLGVSQCVQRYLPKGRITELHNCWTKEQYVIFHTYK